MTDEQTKIPKFDDKDKRETSFFDFGTNKEIVGKLKEIQTGSFGEQYLIDTPDGDIIVGTYGVLGSKINHSDIGKWIKILCKGDVISPKTKRTYKDFEVFIK